MFSPGLTFPPRVGGVRLGPLAPKKGGSFYADWPLAFDFVNNKYRVGIGRGYSSSFLEQPGVTYARTGADLLSYNPVTGNWQAFAANAPALLTGAGQDVPEGTTNKCTNYNAAPDAGLTSVSKSGDAAATLTLVDDTAALRAAGFGDLIDAGKMSGMVYKLDNSLGSTAASCIFSGQVGNTNAHAISIVERHTGTAVLRLQSASGSNIAATSSYVRRTVAPLTPVDATRQLVFEANAGAVAYCILNQLEEKTYATNPVIVSGASASRGVASPLVTGLASLLTPPFTLVAVANLSAIDGVNRDFYYLSDGTANNRIKASRTASSPGEFGYSITSSGIVQGAPPLAGGRSGPRLAKVALRVRAGQMTAAADGVIFGSSSPSMPANLSRLDLGTFLNASGEFLNSPLLFAGIAPDLTDAQLQAITASNGALTDFL